MTKSDEISDPGSCFNKANGNEMMFILLGRDAAAPAAILAWIEERLRLGKNKPGDAQITEALECALQMQMETQSRAREDAWEGDGSFGP